MIRIPSRTVSFQTLGCRLNQFETDSLASSFIKAGWTLVDFGTPADVQIINSCTVTNKADRKSRTELGKAERVAGESLVIVTGCYAENAREELEARQGVDYVVDNQQKSHILDLVEAHFRGEITPGSPAGLRLAGSLSGLERFSYEVADRTFHTRATIKIQDGCDNFCSFCIIPHVRGAAISRPKEDVLDHLRQLLSKGYKEVIITGVNITRYTHEGRTFEDLLEAMLEVEGDWRLRIASVEPENLGEKFFRLLRHPRLCPHLHLCLQSGSDRILKAMNRTYTWEEYRTLALRIRSEVPHFNITTDLIAGFPGESEEDHQATLSAIREIGFGHAHIFPYSRRSGTRADRMSLHLPEADKRRRSQALEAAMMEVKKAYVNSLAGKPQRVLIEKTAENTAWGTGENFIQVKIRGQNLQRNDWSEVILEPGEDPAEMSAVPVFYGTS